MHPTSVEATGEFELARVRVNPILWPILALTASSVAFAIPIGRSTWWMNPDNYASLAWGQEVASLHAITLENALTTPHPLPIALAAALYHGASPIGFFTVMSAVALLIMAICAGVAAHRRAGMMAATLAILFVGASDGIAESAALRGVDLFPAAAIAGALALTPDRWRLRVLLICVAGLVRPEPWALAAVAAFLGYQAPLLRRLGAGIVAGLIAPLTWMTFDWAVAGDPLLAINTTDTLSGIARNLTPLDEAPKTMSKMILTLNEPWLWTAAAVGMALILAEALRRRRLPLDTLPYAIVAVIPTVLMVEIARGYPLRVRYLLPLAIVIAIESASFFVLTGRNATSRFPGLRSYAVFGFVALAAYGIGFAGTRSPQVHTPVEPFINGGVQLLRQQPIACSEIGFLAGRVRDVKAVPPLALHTDEPLGRFRFILPGDPVPPGLEVIVVPREQQIVPDARFHQVAQADNWLLYSSGAGCASGLTAAP